MYVCIANVRYMLVMVYCEASDKKLIRKQPIVTATVGKVCQLEMFLPTWMNPDDISADVTWKGVVVEK